MRFSAFHSSKGIALIMVLWVITMLTFLAIEFSFAMRTEVNITKNYQKDLQLYAAAQGAVHRAVAELMLKQDTRIQQLKRGAKEGDALLEFQEWVTDGREYRVKYERGGSSVRIVGEGGKMNINRVTDSVLRKIMTNMGLEGSERDVIVDSILDWRDPDDFLRINGAESDYYRSLKNPYEAKNGNLDSVEELLLIRGITPELFYGKKKSGEGEEQEEPVGLKDIFSVYAGQQIDINSTSIPVLRAVFGLPLEVCRLIVKAREEKAFENVGDLRTRVPQISPFLAEVSQLIGTGAANDYYSIEARGESELGKSVRGVRAIVKIQPGSKEGFKFIQWQDSLQ